MSDKRRVILVTGCPRSGTTPVGSNLSLAAGARYLYEPFNPNFGMRAISRFYEVPGANGFSLARFDACVGAIRTVRLDLKHFDYPRERGLRRIVKRIIGSRSHMAYRLCRLDWTLRTVIWKDPTACFASAAAVDRHCIPVVVTVRPATAVAASYKRMQWDSGVLQVLDSLEQIGIRYPDLLQEFGRYKDNRAVSAAMLWWVAYTTLLDWAGSRSQIHFFDLQRSIDRPVEAYRALFTCLDLPFDASVGNKLLRIYGSRTVNAKPPAEALPQRAHVAGRSLKEVNTYGRKLLTTEESTVIESMTGALWNRLQAACLAPNAGPATTEQSFVH
jgi:hypothetical protein